jgi:hypothetical protein
MEEIDYILNQSMQGVHVLFDTEVIKKFLSKDVSEDAYSEEQLSEIEQMVEDFITTPTISARKAFFDDLDSDEQELLLKSYFNIIENNIINEGRLEN